MGRLRSYIGRDGKRHEIADDMVMALPAPAALRRMDAAALLAWVQRHNWRRLGGRGGCPWIGEHDGPPKPPKAKSNADHWKAERAAYLRLFAPYTANSALRVQPWTGGEHLHKCPACEVQPRREGYMRYGVRELADAYQDVYVNGRLVKEGREYREAPYWWCDMPDADCSHLWEHPCHEHGPESAVNRQSAERDAEDAAHEEAGGDAPGECYEGEAESGPNGTDTDGEEDADA